MGVNAIQTQDTNRLPFGIIARGSVAGGVLGYAAKNWLPLSESEMDEEYKGAIAWIKKASNNAKDKPIKTIKGLKDKTLAQDTFVKMVDAEGTAATKANNMRKIIKDAKLGKNDMIELQGLIASVNKTALDMSRRCVKGFNSAVKGKRITPAYVAAGAVLGFFAGLGQSVFRASSNV